MGPMHSGTNSGLPIPRKPVITLIKTSFFHFFLQGYYGFLRFSVILNRVIRSFRCYFGYQVIVQGYHEFSQVIKVILSFSASGEIRTLITLITQNNLNNPK